MESNVTNMVAQMHGRTTQRNVDFVDVTSNQKIDIKSIVQMIVQRPTIKERKGTMFTKDYFDEKTKEHEFILNIFDALPHGSGIDYEWKGNKFENGTIYFFNSYHGMDEGGYNRIVPFRIRIFQHKKDELNPLKGPSEGKVQIVHKKDDWDFSVSMDNRWGDRDHIEESIGYALEKLGIGTMGMEIVDA